MGWSIRLCACFYVYRSQRLAHGILIHWLGIREIRMQLANCRPGIRRWNSIEGDAVATFLPGREGMGLARISEPRSRCPRYNQRRHKWGNVTIIEIHLCVIIEFPHVLPFEARDNNLSSFAAFSSAHSTLHDVSSQLHRWLILMSLSQLFFIKYYHLKIYIKTITLQVKALISTNKISNQEKLRFNNEISLQTLILQLSFELFQ